MIDITQIRPDIAVAKQRLPPLEKPGDFGKVTHPGTDLPDPTIRWLGGHRYKLIEDDCRIPDFRNRRYHVVEEGFEFDAASVPRVAWAFISPVDLGVLAVLSHDDLYDRGGVTPHSWVYTRREADVLFYDLMLMEGIVKWRRRAAYQAVRKAGGISAWRGQ